ncbi:MAG: hypothetical protein WCI04_06980 [archaeon]
MEFDFGKIVDFSLFKWAKEEGIWKYFLALLVFTAVISFSTYYMMGTLLSPFSALQDQSVTEAINAIFHFFTFIFFIIIVSVVFGAAFNYLLIAMALRAKGKKFVDFGAKRWLGIIVLGILNFFAALFSVFKLKLLVVGIVGLVLTGISVILIVMSGIGGNWGIAVLALLFFLLGLILLMVYLIIVVYNCLRLSFSSIVFIEKELGFVESMHKSWEMTHGKVLNILVALILIGLIAAVISLIGSFPLSVYNFVAGISSGGMIGITNLFNPLFLILNIPALVTSTIGAIISAFGLVAIYEQLQVNTISLTKPKKLIAKRRATKK